MKQPGLKHPLLHAVVLVGLLLHPACNLIHLLTRREPPPIEPEVEDDMRGLLRNYSEKLSVLEEAANRAEWEFARPGREEDAEAWKKARLALRIFHADAERFSSIEVLRLHSPSARPVLVRQLDLAYFNHKKNQLPTEIIQAEEELFTRITRIFTTTSPRLHGKTVTRSHIRHILRNANDPVLRKKAWMASKEVGAAVAPALIALVKLRNKGARLLGFKDFHEMKLLLDEQEPLEIVDICTRLETLTEPVFSTMKQKLDRALASRFKIRVEALRPWHHGDLFIQEGPTQGAGGLDAGPDRKDLVPLAQDFFTSIGFGEDVTRVLERSDLYERPGKSPHAFCTHIDRSGDVRIFCNLGKAATRAATLFHELGHAVYGRNIDATMPFLFREPAHTFTSEAVARLFQRMTTDPARVASSSPEAAGGELDDARRLGMLFFVRRSLVLAHFERELYANPDQDLSKLWWELVERYQKVRRPENCSRPDWAAGIQFTNAPVCSHNHLLGELMAAQLMDFISRTFGEGEDPAHFSLLGRKDVGEYLRNRVFKPGRRFPYQELLFRATGSPLDPKFFLAQFAEKE